MNRLDRLSVRGFKSIRELDLELDNVNVLIGGNGAGKSNLLSLFRMLGSMAAGGLQEWIARAGGAKSVLHYGPKVTPCMEVGLEFQVGSDSGSYHARLASAPVDTLVFAREDLLGTGQQGKAAVHIGHRGSVEGLVAKGDAPECLVSQVLHQCQVFQFHDTSESARIRAKAYINDNQRLHGDAGNLAAFLYMLKQTKPPYYRRIVDTIRDVAPHFGHFELEPDKLSPTEIMLNWREAGADYLFGPHQLPDGLLRFMALAALLLQPEDELPSVLAIDEPELGLHPYAVNVLGSLIRKASAHGQVILATQSVNLVDQFQPEEIVAVERTGNVSTFRRLRSEELAEWLDEYSLSDLWEKNVIGGRPSR